MNSIFDQTYNRRSSDSIKWNLYDEDVLPLWVADMDFPAPRPVIDAVAERLSHGIFGYAKSQEATKAAIQSWLLKHHDWFVELDEILLVSCVVQAFNFTAAAFANPGDSVLIQTPAYHPFLQVAENNRLKLQIHQLPRDSDGKYIFLPEEFENSFNPSSRIFMLCNPHNPSGRVFSRKELIEMADACLRNNVLICSDEIHSDLVFSKHKHIPIASISDEVALNTITLISASKTFNLAGLKSSAVIIKNPILRDQFQAKLRGLAGSVNILGETAMRAAYSEGEPWLSELLQFLENNRDTLVRFVQSEIPGISIYPPDGTYLGWLDCTDTNLQSPAEYFLQAAKVALNQGDWFGENFTKFVRINFACPHDTLLAALERMKNSLDADR